MYFKCCLFVFREREIPLFLAAYSDNLTVLNNNENFSHTDENWRSEILCQESEFSLGRVKEASASCPSPWIVYDDFLPMSSFCIFVSKSPFLTRTLVLGLKLT